MFVAKYPNKSAFHHKGISFFISAFCLLSLTMTSVASIGAQDLSDLPQPGAMVALSSPFSPVILKGLATHSDNPLAFDFIVDLGHIGVTDEALSKEAQNLIKYFLAALAIPENKSWVNLSPYEGDRIIPDLLAATEMGKQMLEQDYLLKQLSASLTNPEQELGKKFWDKVYKRAFELYGTTDVPINTFNKVWILPQKAEVLEHDGYAFISSSRLKVMVDEDYTALKENGKSKKFGTNQIDQDQVAKLSAVSSQIVKEIIIPELEKEVNEGQNFAPVRQIYHSVILATWYKLRLQQTLLGQIYVDQGKIKGVDIPEKDLKQKVYDQYLEAFRRGVYSIFKEDYDLASQELMPRKYFSGGLTLASSNVVEIKSGIPDFTGELTLVEVGGKYTETKFEEGFYSELTPQQKAALKPAGPFNPLDSPNTKIGHWEDGAETIFAYDSVSEATYVVFDPSRRDPTVVKVPGNLSDSELIFSAFQNAQDFRQWLNKNSALSRNLSYEQQGFFHATLAKAMFAVDEDLDFERNAGVNNLLSLLEYLQGTGAVADLKRAMSQATPAGRQKILDDALAAALIAQPQFILNAAQLLGLDLGNPKLTVYKDVVGGTMTNTYNPDDDLSIFIVRRGLEHRVYGVQGNLEPILELSTAFETASDVDKFLTHIKTSQNTGSGFVAANGDYTLDGDYVLALTRSRLIPPDEFASKTSTVRKFAEEADQQGDEDAQNKSISQSPEVRKDAFIQQVLPKLFAKVSAGVDYIKRFLKFYTIPKAHARLVSYKDGQLRIAYNSKTHQTTFRISPILSVAPKKIKDNSFMPSRNIFNGNLGKIPFEDVASAREVQELLRIGKTNGFSAEQRVHLLEELVAAHKLKEGEFETTDEGAFGTEVEEILYRFRNVDAIVKRKQYIEMKELSSASARKQYFMGVFLPQLVEDLEHQVFVAENSHTRLPDHEDLDRSQSGDEVPQLVLINKLDGTITISYDTVMGKSQVVLQSTDISGRGHTQEYLLAGDWRQYSLESYNTVQEIQTQMNFVAQAGELTSREQWHLLQIINKARALPLSAFQNNYSEPVNYVNALVNSKSADTVKKLFLEMRVETDLQEKQNRFVALLVDLLNEKPELFSAIGQALKVDFHTVRLTFINPDVPVVAAASSAADSRVGGIDFDAQLLDLQIKRDTRGVALPLPQQNLDQIHIEGLYPVILNISPVNAQTVPLLFGRTVEKPSSFPIASAKSLN